MKHTLETLLELAKTGEGRMRIRVMVAELNGYERRPDGRWRRVGEVGSCGIPQYTTSLDAMAEAKACLGSIEALAKYADNLEKVCVPTHICSLTHWKSIVMATALQRSIAFILTKQT